METLDQYIQNLNRAAYRNASVNAKSHIGPSRFYREAIDTIRYYKTANSHKVNSIQAYCNLMGYSSLGGV